jgi:hypothetical protein
LLIPQDSRASPADLFTMPSQMEHFLTFYDVIKVGMGQFFIHFVTVYRHA